MSSPVQIHDRGYITKMGNRTKMGQRCGLSKSQKQSRDTRQNSTGIASLHIRISLGTVLERISGTRF